MDPRAWALAAAPVCQQRPLAGGLPARLASPESTPDLRRRALRTVWAATGRARELGSGASAGGVAVGLLVGCGVLRGRDGRARRGRRDRPPQARAARLPAEWEPHERTLVSWPCAALLASGSPRPEIGVSPDDWFQEVHFEELVRFIELASRFEQVGVVVNPADLEDCRGRLAHVPAVEYLEVEKCNLWMRDTGPSFLVGSPVGLVAIAWQWHGYGPPTGSIGQFKHSVGRRDLYENYCMSQWELFCNRDVTFSYRLAADLRCMDLIEAGVAFEGGAVVVDGEGTGIVVWQMLARMGDTDDLEALEEALRKATGLEKIIWLPRGLEEDDCNAHADMVCAFIGPAQVLLVSNGEYGEENFRALEGEKDARGRPIQVFRLPHLPPSLAETSSSAVLGAFGRFYSIRDRSYANLAFVDGAVLLPSYGDPERDAEAERVVREALASAQGLSALEVVRVPWRELSRFGGSLRCASLPVPAR